MKTAATIENEIRDYVKTLRKDRGEVTSVEVKKLNDYVKSPRRNDEYFVGGFVTFNKNETIFVYRLNNGKRYGTFGGYNSERKVAEVVNGWNDTNDVPEVAAA
jgi:hypothetical protein